MSDTVGSAKIELFASLDKLRTGLRTARRETDRAASDMAESAGLARRSFERAGDGLTRSMRTARAEVQGLNRELRGTDAALAGIFAGAGAGLAVQQIVGMADEFTNLRARIALVTTAGESAADVFNRIFEAAQRNSTSVEALASLYVRLRQSIAGLSDSEALSIGETLSQTLAISGASAAESTAFLRQIGQALASGVLRGDEFNSVMESNSRFAALLADQLGVGVGELRAMAEQGKLTADVIRGAISGGGGGIADEFAALPLTVGRALQQLQNATLRYVGETDSGLGASVRLAQGIELLADNFGTLADAVIVLGAAGLANLFGRGVAGVAAATASAIGASVGAVDTEIHRLVERSERASDLLAKRRAEFEFHRRAFERAQKEIRDTNYFREAEGRPISRRVSETLPYATSDQARLAILKKAEADYAALDKKYEDRLRRMHHASDVAFGNMSRAQRQLTQSTELYGKVSERAAAAVTLGARASQGAAVAANALARGFSSLVGALGGPIPALITAISVALIFYKSSADKAREANNSLANALGVLAGAQVAAAGGAGDAAGAVGDLGAKTGIAAEAVDALAAAHTRAAGAARTQADAEAALAEVQRIQAIATIQSAIADQRKAAAAARSRAQGAGARIGDYIQYDTPQSQAIAKSLAARLNAAVADEDQANRSIDLLQRGLAALTSGTLTLGRAQSATSESTAKLATETGNLATNARRAAAFQDDLNAAIDAAGEPLVTMHTEMGGAAVERYTEDMEKARRIIEDATDQLTLLREEFLEIDRLSQGGFFSGQEETGARAMVRVLQEMARAAGDAAEAMALLKTVEGLDPKDREAATRNIQEAARQGREERRAQDEARKVISSADVRDAVSGGLYDAVTSGQWRDAFRNALHDLANRGLRRAIDALLDAIWEASKGGGKGGGGLGSTIASVIGNIFGGGKPTGSRANGGPVIGGQAYRVNEVFVPETNGRILSAHAARAMGGVGTEGPAPIVQNINIDARGSEGGVVMEAKLEAAAQRGAIMGAEMVQRQLRAQSTL